jgi:hypothetical protein
MTKRRLRGLFIFLKTSKTAIAQAVKRRDFIIFRHMNTARWRRIISMRLSTLLLFFVTSAFAQVSQPMTFQETRSGQWQGKNIAPKEILAYVVEFESTHTRFIHDYYFKPEGVMPNTLEDFTPLQPPQLPPPGKAQMTGGKVIYVQFVDGTEWGDHPIGEEKLLRERKPRLRLIADMVDAYSRSGDKGFSDYIETAKTSDNILDRSFAKHVWMMQQQSGIDGALGFLKMRLASAAKHDKTLMENR